MALKFDGSNQSNRIVRMSLSIRVKILFRTIKKAALINWINLLRHGCKLEDALINDGDSPLRYGSEFRGVPELETIFGHHPNWERMKRLLLQGSNPILDGLDFDSRANDLNEALEYGNHKSASEKVDLLRELVEDDVIHAYALPIPRDKLKMMKGALVAPMGIQRQNTIDEHGKIIQKDRLTHDQSFKFGSGTSFNSRVDKDELLPCMFGKKLQRLMNWAVAARRMYPRSKIFCQKIDFKSAFRRLHLNAEVAIQSCTQLPEKEIALIPLRMTFGGAPNPSEWGVISETSCDLANELLSNDGWNPLQLHSPNQHLVPPRQALSDDIPFAEGRELIVDVPMDPRGTADVYIDDKTSLSIDVQEYDNIDRLERASLLAIHMLARPKHMNEPILREDMEALKKLLAEAGAEETKIILGWFFDFRRLLISLPENKFVSWSESIISIINDGKSTAEDLDTLIGRIVHLGQVLPQVHHFVSRLRELKEKAEKSKRRHIKITGTCIKDLELMQLF